MSNPLSRLTLRVTVPLVLVVPVLVTAIAMVLIGATLGRRATERLAAEGLAHIHSQIAERVDGLLTLPARINRVTESLIEDGRIDPANVRDWRKVLFTEVKGAASISSIVWGGAGGEDVNIARYAGDKHYTFFVKDARSGGLMQEYALDDQGDIVGPPLRATPFDPRQRPWYKAAVKADKPVWGEPYVWVSRADDKRETLGIAYSQPCRSADGRLLGVIASELSLDDISHFLGRLHVGKSGLVFIMYGDGRLVACSTGAPLIDASDRPVVAWESTDPKVAAAASYMRDAQGRPKEAIKIDGRRYLLRVSSLDHATGLRWRIVTLAPESDFLAEIQAGRRISYGVAAGVILAAILLGLLLAGGMTRPILALVAHVRRIGAGDLDGELSLRQSPELRELSREINTMMAGLRDRLRMRQSLALAMEVQQNLLPRQTPKVKGLDISGHSTYCDETGGDYYDYLELIGLSDSTIAVAIGDVSGHGIAAAMVMAGARGVLRSRSSQPGTLAEMLTHMNDLMASENSDGRFMTMLLMTLDSDRREMRWASAGHDMPFVYDPAADLFHGIEGAGVPLGVMAGEVYQEYSLANIPPGAVILAGTDGVWEAINADGDIFGKERVCETIRHCAGLSAEEINNRLRQDLASFRGRTSQQDDITFVVVKMV